MTADNFTVESLAVENSLGDGIKVEGTTGGRLPQRAGRVDERTGHEQTAPTASTRSR